VTRTWLHLLWIALACTVYEVQFLYHPPNPVDEGWPLYAAQRLHAGGTLYADTFFVFPPGHLLSAWIGSALAPPGIVAARVLYAAFDVALCLALYAFARRLMPAHLALLAALLVGFALFPYPGLQATDLLVIFDSPDVVRSASPDIGLLGTLPVRGIIISSADDDYDFIARFFAPAVGVPEDPVTGSAYTELAPYWSAKTGKTRLRAKQVSRRGGQVTCELAGDRVHIAGTAVKTMEGVIHIDG